VWSASRLIAERLGWSVVEAFSDDDLGPARLQVMAAIMEQDVTAVCGVKGCHESQRVAVRHDHERGSVTLGGRRVPVGRPWMRGRGLWGAPGTGLRGDLGH